MTLKKGQFWQYADVIVRIVDNWSPQKPSDRWPEGDVMGRKTKKRVFEPR